MVVTFGGLPASIVSITEPDTIVVDPPDGPRGTSVDVVVSGSNGLDTAVDGYSYDALEITATSAIGANLTGGATITLSVNHPTTPGDTTATLGGNPVTVSAVTATTVDILIPTVPEATGDALDITVTNSNGSGTLVGGFTYTPALSVGVTGSAAAGGTLDVAWLTDPAVGPGQLVTMWLGDLIMPPVSATLNGYAGLLHPIPFIFIFVQVPETTAPISLPFGPQPPAVSGLPLDLQLAVSGEGGSKGGFSNAVTFAIP
jgi:hypothetical protein